jgi:hypothetical protein
MQTGSLNSHGVNLYAGGISGGNEGFISKCFVQGSISAFCTNSTAGADSCTHAAGVAAFNKNSSASIASCAVLSLTLKASNTSGASALYAARITAANQGTLNTNYAQDTIALTPSRSQLSVGDSNMDGAGVAINTILTDIWWKNTLLLNFGSSEDQPWIWDDDNKIPRLWFEQ